MKHEDFRLGRPEIPRLSKADFDPSGECLDAKSAWKNLGGKTLVAAYELFLSNPTAYQEDYMWMGVRAFDYYFPVLDEYLRGASIEDDEDDREAVILGSCVAAQFQMNGDKPSVSTQQEVTDLAEFVLANLALFSSSEKTQQRIAQSWQKAQAATE